MSGTLYPPVAAALKRVIHLLLSLTIHCLCGDDRYEVMPTTRHNIEQFT